MPVEITGPYFLFRAPVFGLNVLTASSRNLATKFVTLFVAMLALHSSVALADSVVVFNEIMFHPAINEPAMEWVELHNQNSVNVDLSGWKLTGGIDYTFPDGTVIRGGGHLVVAVSPATLVAATGATNVLGPFTGRLSNNGEELRLRDLNNRLMDSVSYGVDGEWPEGADGSGMSLVKRHPNLAFSAGLRHYQHAEWDQAVEQFSQVIVARKDDGPSRFYLLKIEKMRHETLPPKWFGEVSMDEK